MMLNFQLIDNIDFENGLNDKDEKQFDEFLKTKVELKNNNIVKKELKKLQEYFDIYGRFTDSMSKYLELKKGGGRITVYHVQHIWDKNNYKAS